MSSFVSLNLTLTPNLNLEDPTAGFGSPLQGEFKWGIGPRALPAAKVGSGRWPAEIFPGLDQAEGMGIFLVSAQRVRSAVGAPCL